MKSVNMHDAKTNLSRLVADAAAGEPFIIARAGRPLVKVVPITPGDAEVRRRIGFLPDTIVPDDFDHMAGDEISDLFEGKT